MVDSDVVGCCWIELPKGTYRVREEKGPTDTNSQNPAKVGVGVVAHSLSDLAVTLYQLCSVRLYTLCFWTFSYFFLSVRCPCVSTRWM